MRSAAATLAAGLGSPVHAILLPAARIESGGRAEPLAELGVRVRAIVAPAVATTSFGLSNHYFMTEARILS